MAKKSVAIECGECGAKFQVVYDSEEMIQCCPFCSDWVTLPDDLETESILDDDLDDDYDQLNEDPDDQSDE